MKKNIFLLIPYIYIILFAFICMHYMDYSLTILWVTILLFFIVYAFYLRKFLFILAIIATLAILLPLSINPYTHYIISSASVEKEIASVDGEIFIVKFNDRSSATVIYGKEKACIGKEYESKYRCRFVLSVIDKYIAAQDILSKPNG